MALLEVQGLYKILAGKEVVSDVSFNQVRGEKIAIVGEAGSGKTTLLKMIGGLMQPDGGQAFLSDIKIKGPDDVLIPGHKQIAYLSQHFELRNNYRVFEVLQMASKVSDNAAKQIYDLCRISEYLQRWTDELSGGERQRVALARLLVASPTLLLLDEPFSNLDAANKRTIQNVLHDISQQIGMTCLMVSHDAADTLAWADVILVMKNGKIIQQGTANTIYYKPFDTYCATFFGPVNFIQKNALCFDSALHKTNFFVRPEHLKVSPPAGDKDTGLVTKNSFRGSHYSLEVQTSSQVFFAQVSTNAYPVGSYASISIAPDYFHI